MSPPRRGQPSFGTSRSATPHGVTQHDGRLGAREPRHASPHRDSARLYVCVSRHDAWLWWPIERRVARHPSGISPRGATSRPPRSSTWCSTRARPRALGRRAAQDHRGPVWRGAVRKGHEPQLPAQAGSSAVVIAVRQRRGTPELTSQVSRAARSTTRVAVTATSNK